MDGGKDAVVRAAVDVAATIAQKSPLAVAGTKALLEHARDHTCVAIQILHTGFPDFRPRRVQENLEYTAVWNSAALQSDVR